MYILQRAQSFLIMLLLYNFVAFITSQSPVDSTAGKLFVIFTVQVSTGISSDIFALADQR